MYTAAPSPLERVAPDSLDGNEFSILGYTIPPGTIIASQAWSSHRDPNIFTDPEQFIPGAKHNPKKADVYSFGMLLCHR